MKYKNGIEKDKIKYWYFEGKLHGTPAVEFPDGDFINMNMGKFHCTTGPSAVLDGKEFYHIHGISYNKQYFHDLLGI